MMDCYYIFCPQLCPIRIFLELTEFWYWRFHQNNTLQKKREKVGFKFYVFLISLGMKLTMSSHIFYLLFIKRFFYTLAFWHAALFLLLLAVIKNNVLKYSSCTFKTSVRFKFHFRTYHFTVCVPYKNFYCLAL